MNTVRMLSAAVLAVLAGVLVAPAAQGEPAATTQPEVLAEIPHDPDAFTQGLELADSVLYEGTGLAGQSQLRTLDPATGQVDRAEPIPGDYFGEGITVVGDRIWQLTYQDGVAVQWDRATMTPVREVPLAGEGWGLCYDGQRLVRSDGTDRLRFHDPGDMGELGGVDVTRDGAPVTGLNELECVEGRVWANVWPTDTIVRIDPGDGAVDLVVDAAALRERGIPPSAQVLNGIAHVGGDEFLVTGKDWPTMFRVRLG
ncbi:glutaminyl-peptide cyclotransferase [Mycolicibacterium poriferae]|uniref:Glutaminyl-peptide cyclotransferase n=1 Tax=Mycolicibacterium poriferae TaxID=39694 RepID=A0A6N4V5N5_9MYCO|nr:glutaminyl-peptide cyclotransferase [Mycolicibacterium poriferae]MCV7262385.1 glutaminyl-peptide cyclotransferase [Mycolicibacterium poriferae]BBX49328.1 glutaminyl-peptide cyclotransferase [Mycolicibacterium poriferae]